MKQYNRAEIIKLIYNNKKDITRNKELTQEDKISILQMIPKKYLIKFYTTEFLTKEDKKRILKLMYSYEVKHKRPKFVKITQPRSCSTKAKAKSAIVRDSEFKIKLQPCKIENPQCYTEYTFGSETKSRTIFTFKGIIKKNNYNSDIERS